MEIVGLTASIGALAELTLKVFTTLYTYYGDVKNGPSRSAELRDELGAMLALFEGLKQSLSRGNYIDNTGANLHGELGNLHEILVEMQDRVKADQTRGIRRMTWPFKEGENKKFIERLERCKSTFNLALNIDQR